MGWRGWGGGGDFSLGIGSRLWLRPSRAVARCRLLFLTSLVLRLFLCKIMIIRYQGLLLPGSGDGDYDAGEARRMRTD